MSVELNPCPFCGNENVFVVNPRLMNSMSFVKNARMEIACDECGFTFNVGLFGKAYDDLTDEDVLEIERSCAEKWNRRADNGRK